MKVEINHECANYDSFRANKVKSLFNPEHGHTWHHVADLPIEEKDWQIGLIVGPSGSGKTSIGSEIFGNDIHDLYEGWPGDFTTVQRAWAVWVLSKMGFAGQLSNSFGFDKSEGRHPRKVHFAKEAFTVELRKRLEIATIESDDAFKVIARYDTPDTFHFIDPPYVGSYSEMFDDADLERLLQLCETLTGKFMLTMFPHKVIRSYSEKNGWLINSVERTISAAKNDRRKQEEWMICNYDPPVEQGALNLFAA